MCLCECGHVSHLYARRQLLDPESAVSRVLIMQAVSIFAGSAELYATRRVARARGSRPYDPFYPISGAHLNFKPRCNCRPAWLTFPPFKRRTRARARTARYLGANSHEMWLIVNVILYAIGHRAASCAARLSISEKKRQALLSSTQRTMHTNRESFANFRRTVLK